MQVDANANNKQRRDDRHCSYQTSIRAFRLILRTVYEVAGDTSWPVKTLSKDTSADCVLLVVATRG